MQIKYSKMTNFSMNRVIIPIENLVYIIFLYW